MSLYAAYVAERDPNTRVYETEKGMATYSILGTELYIKEIYVLPDFRKQGEASRLADEVAELARKRGCTFMTGTVDPGAVNSTESLQVLIGYGMRLHSINQSGLIVFYKDL